MKNNKNNYIKFAFSTIIIVLALTLFMSNGMAVASNKGVKVEKGWTPIPGGEANSENDITMKNSNFALTISGTDGTKPPWGVPRGGILDGAPVVNGEIQLDRLIIVDFLPDRWAAWPTTYQEVEIVENTEEKGVVEVRRDYDNAELIFETNENDTITSNDAVYTFPAEGPYTATLIIDRSNGACTDTITKIVNLIPGPDILFTTSTNAGEAPLYVEFYNESNGAVSYLWDFANGNSENTLDETTVTETFENAGQFPVTLFGTSDDGCTSSHTEVIFVEYPELLVEIPNIFTPNGDGVNDEFFINYIDAKETITSFNLEIVNRWGNLITESNDPGFKWDGRTLSGTLVNDGSYFYIVTFNTLKEDNIIKQGFVQVESD